MDDDDLLDRVRRAAAAADPVPDHVRRAAAAAFAFRDPDAALAELVGDSAAGIGYEAVRTDRAGEQLLSYELDGARAELEVTVTGDGPVLTGQLIDAGGPDCELETGAGERRAVELDEYGRFLLADVPPGPARLRFLAPAGRRMVTPWFLL
jgi:hypothetical protein